MNDFPAEPESFHTLAGIEAWFSLRIQRTQKFLDDLRRCEYCQISNTECQNCANNRDDLVRKLEIWKTVCAREKSDFRLGTIPPPLPGHNPYKDSGAEIGWSWGRLMTQQDVGDIFNRNSRKAKEEVTGLQPIKERYGLCPAAAEILRKNLWDLRGFEIEREIHTEVADAKCPPYGWRT